MYIIKTKFLNFITWEIQNSIVNKIHTFCKIVLNPILIDSPLYMANPLFLWVNPVPSFLEFFENLILCKSDGFSQKLKKVNNKKLTLSCWTGHRCFRYNPFIRFMRDQSESQQKTLLFVTMEIEASEKKHSLQKLESCCLVSQKNIGQVCLRQV